MFSGADPGFPIGGGTDPGGMPTYNFTKISKNLHEIEKFWAGDTPLGLPMVLLCYQAALGAYQLKYLQWHHGLSIDLINLYRT